MKVLFISDIHANLEALKAVETLFEKVDKVVCLGDVVGYGSHVNEVIDLIRRYEIPTIMGNHDYFVVEGYEHFGKKLNEAVLFGLNEAKVKITESNLKWLSELPLNYGFLAGDKSIFCCHGSPWDPLREYVYPDYKSFDRFKEFNYDVIAMGHTHRMVQKNNDNQLVINPGSVGQARDLEGKVCAMIYNSEMNSIENVILDYNFKEELDYSLLCGAKDWVFKHFASML